MIARNGHAYCTCFATAGRRLVEGRLEAPLPALEACKERVSWRQLEYDERLFCKKSSVETGK